MTVPALTGIEQFSVPGVGRLESFYTDGLRTLLKTMRKIRNMEEKTIRYCGHAMLFKNLIACGFFSNAPIKLKNTEIPCREFTLRYLQNELSKGPEYDLTVLIIRLKGQGQTRAYQIIDYYDKKNQITSMARMTAYTCAVLARCIKSYPRYGVIPPEYLGMVPDLCNYIKTELKNSGIKIRVSNRKV